MDLCLVHPIFILPARKKVVGETSLYWYVILLTADAEPTDIVLVPNATTGINIVIQSLIKTFHTGDSIFPLSLTYGALFKLSVCGDSLPGSFLKDLRASDMIVSSVVASFLLPQELSRSC